MNPLPQFALIINSDTIFNSLYFYLTNFMHPEYLNIIKLDYMDFYIRKLVKLN